jgi:hypothetical protein
MVKDAKLEGLKDVLSHLDSANGTAADEVIKEQAKVLGQQMSVTYFVHKNWYIFCSENEIIVKMSSV